MGQPERPMQNCIIALFRDGLGYRYLGDWTTGDRLGETRAAYMQSLWYFQ